jgi:hypothetical protein
MKAVQLSQYDREPELVDVPDYARALQDLDEGHLRGRAILVP